MVNALTPLFTPPAWSHRLMMNKSLRAREPKSSRNRFYGFQTMRWRKEDAEKAHAKKKSRRFRRL
jgi:hypothetical protein